MGFLLALGWCRRFGAAGCVVEFHNCTMATIRLRGVEIPLEADWFNPQYRAGVRHCFAVLSGLGRSLSTDTFDYEGVVLFVESDMWHIAAALSAMTTSERERHGWIDLFPHAAIATSEPHSNKQDTRLGDRWRSALAGPVPSIGVLELDDEHRMIRRTLLRLKDQCVHDVRVSEVIPVLLSLLGEIRVHFQHEEAMMEQSAYPQRRVHAIEHSTCLGKIQNAVREYTDRKLLLSEALLGFCELETNHIQTSDAMYGVFVASERGQISAG